MAIVTRKLLIDWEAPPPGGNADGALSYRLEDADHVVLIATTTAGVVNYPPGTSLYELNVAAWDTAWDALAWRLFVTDGVDTEVATNTDPVAGSSGITVALRWVSKWQI